MSNRQEILEQLRQESIRVRGQALHEQAKNRQAISPPIPSAAGASGSGFLNECNPLNGIGVYITDNFEIGEEEFNIPLLIRTENQGNDENGRPTYGGTLITDLFEVTINYDANISKWKFTLYGVSSVSGPYINVFTSDTLIGSNWTVDDQGAGFSFDLTTCGYRELPEYCIDFPELENVGLVPAWFENQNRNTEPPGLWWGVAVVFVWGPLIGLGEGWFITAQDLGDVFIPGGSINELPAGSIELDGGTITVTEGRCNF